MTRKLYINIIFSPSAFVSIYSQLSCFNMQNSLCFFGILSIFSVVVRGAPTSRRCQSTQKNIHGCCDGYIWKHVENDCVKCLPGYTGVGCTIKCSPPLFGEYCQNICMCSPEEFCDFVYGCLKINETSSTGMPGTEITTNNDKDYTNHFVDNSTQSQERTRGSKHRLFAQYFFKISNKFNL